MKKKIKVIIALVVIIAIAFGVYMFFGQGTDNKQIRAKVYALNNELVIEEENIFEKTNSTIKEMLLIIESKGYNIPAQNEYFEKYIKTLNYYNIVLDDILSNGLYVNNVNTGSYFKLMNSSYTAVVNSYKKGNQYLNETYYLITNDANYNSDYIINFYNIFKDALGQLNSFYYNATKAHVKGTRSLINNDNLYKLKLENYITYVNMYVKYSSIESPDVNLINKIQSQIDAKLNSLSTHSINTYIQNKELVDKIFNSKIIAEELVGEFLEGTLENYILEIKDEEQKSITTGYYDLIIKG